MTQSNIGRVLQSYCQMIYIPGADIFGQAYIAKDTKDVDYPEKPRKIVREPKVKHCQSNSCLD